MFEVVNKRLNDCAKMNYSREDALKLNEEKIKIENEVTEWKSILDSEQNIGMDGPLVDSEGFPRDDIDIPKIRMARQKIICLSNDHKNIMKKISEALISIHAQNQNEPETSVLISTSLVTPKQACDAHVQLIFC